MTKQPKAYSKKTVTLLKTKKTTVEAFVGKSTGKDQFKSYFLYCHKPTAWRENWRGIRGFYTCVFGYYLIFAVWR